MSFRNLPLMWHVHQAFNCSLIIGGKLMHFFFFLFYILLLEFQGGTGGIFGSLGFLILTDIFSFIIKMRFWQMIQPFQPWFNIHACLVEFRSSFSIFALVASFKLSSPFFSGLCLLVWDDFISANSLIYKHSNRLDV